MRVLVFALAVASCAPKVNPNSPADEDLGARGKPQPAATAPVEAARPEAPVGKGLRTGTIERAKLLAVLDGGPGMFLRQLEVTPRLDGQRFVGWQLVQLLDQSGPLVDVDVTPGDVLLAINGKALSRPDQLQTIWDSLRSANSIRAELWRGNAKFALEFAIEPKVATP